MDHRYKQLEQELSALSKVFSDLGIRLSEVAKEVTSAGVMPSEKLVEQISASRTSFENCRTAIHGHAGSMLVSPLPKMAELVSITAIDSLLKAAALAEETKFLIEGERVRALEILGRALAITHRDTTEFKPLQECHARVGELRNAISSVMWPHKHPESESIVADKHPSTALLSFVENLDALEDERWMALETTITESYGKALFVAASRGKLAIGAEVKADGQSPASKPHVAAPVPAKAPVVTPPEAPKPVTATEKQKAPEKPAATPAPVPAAPAASVEKKVAAPPAPVAPAAAAPAVAMERKEAGQDKTPQKPAVPQTVTAPPAPASPVHAVPAAPMVSAEKKEFGEKPQPVAAPVAPAIPAVAQIPVTPAPVAPQAVASVVPAPPAVVVTPSSPAPVAAAQAHSVPVASVPAAAPPRPPAPVPVAAQNAPAPVAATPAPAPSAPPVATNSHATPSAQPQHVAGSLSALATATDLSPDKRTAPADAIDRQRREPRLAAPVPQAVAKTEPTNNGEFTNDEAEKAAAGDSSQRPQRWGFWRGNRT
jgi:hypothetical protein